MRSLLCFIASIILFSGIAAEPLLQIETTRLPVLAQEISRLGNAVAPRLKDSTAAGMVVLAFTGMQFGMDATRPVLISLYSFGEKPLMRVTAYLIPETEIVNNEVKLWGMHFKVRKSGELAVLENGKITAPPEIPGVRLAKNERIRIRFMTDQFGKHFRFVSLQASDRRNHLFLQGIDELMTQLKSLELSFISTPQLLTLRMKASVKSGTAVDSWLRKAGQLPPPVKPHIFPGTEYLTILRIRPTETLCRYGELYLSEKFPAGLFRTFSGSAAGMYGNEKARLDFGLIPSGENAARQYLRKLEYTPFQGLYRIHKTPPLFAEYANHCVNFYGMTEMSPAELKNLRTTQSAGIQVPALPFVLYDLKYTAKPVMRLDFTNHEMILTAEASDEWFNVREPILKTPLHQIDWRHPAR